jgi:hypothetical protein
MRSILLAVVAISLGFVPAQAQDAVSDVLPGCQDYVAVGRGKSPPKRGDLVATAECVAMIKTILLLEKLLVPELRFCRPDGVSVNDSVELVVGEAGRRSRIGDKPFFIVAIAIFKERWPCR